MKSFFSSLNLKLIITIIALVVGGLVIWFIGPLMSFDALRPLASVNMRVTVIVLLLTLAIFTFTVNGLWSSIGIGLIGVVALCILVWHAGPLLKFGSAVPLGDESSRILMIFIITLAYLIWVALQVRNAMRTDKDFLNQVLNWGQKTAPAERLAENNLKEVKGIVTQTPMSNA
jgi:type VI secretion system protein ImpL